MGRSPLWGTAPTRPDGELPTGAYARAMQVHLVRHACAGRKSDWDGPDATRPLDDVGRQQAHDLARHLDAVPLRRVLTSPTTRCVETIAEAGERHGLAVEPTALLAADADPTAVLDLVSTPALADVALCTHGETLEAVLSLLRAAGTVVRPDGSDDDRLMLKGSVWTLTVAPGSVPAVTELVQAVPSTVESCAAHPERRAAERVPPRS